MPEQEETTGRRTRLETTPDGPAYASSGESVILLEAGGLEDNSEVPGSDTGAGAETGIRADSSKTDSCKGSTGAGEKDLNAIAGFGGMGSARNPNSKESNRDNISQMRDAKVATSPCGDKRRLREESYPWFFLETDCVGLKSSMTRVEDSDPGTSKPWCRSKPPVPTLTQNPVLEKCWILKKFVACVAGVAMGFVAMAFTIAGSLAGGPQYLPVNPAFTYYVPWIQKSWQDASLYCQAMGANLVSIHSEDDHRKITDMNYLEFWTGLFYNTTNSTWQWSNGNPVNFTKWANGQPSAPSTYSCAREYYGLW
nr:PREDICTED: uncharacterized protein LOC102347229 [Latimeria chalumnae]|eukprot:XP_014353358.1 PREDICTED: uncharacterized protein LOC102347229 [Latimeria chalumnae]